MEADQVPTTIITREKLFMLLSCILLAIGAIGGPLITRLYFIHGGNSIWLSSWLQTAGFPVVLIPLAAAYLHRLKTEGSAAQLFVMKPFLFFVSAAIGLLIGVITYLFSFGSAKLPVSTSGLIYTTQLGFTAGFAFLLVRQKFTSYSVNAVVLLTVGAVGLALQSSGDKPIGESQRDYVVGFSMAIVGSLLNGFILPAAELAFKKTKQGVSFAFLIEYQLVLCVFSASFSTVGMLLNNDFQAIPKEAREFGLGEGQYYLVLFCTAIVWQCLYLGANGVVFCVSSLLAGILQASTIPITELLGVFFYREQFQTQKGIALVLCLWGIVSYFYGEIKSIRKRERAAKLSPETEPFLAVAP